MWRRRALTWMSLGAVMVAACGKAPVPSTKAPRAVAQSKAASLGADENRELCLADTGGTSVVDTQLRVLQDGVRKLPAKVDGWILAGRHWVRKARLASDPGFYVNVEGCAAVGLDLEPGLVPALELRGLVLMNDHKFEEVLRLAEEILAKDPEEVIALGALSDALLELGRYDESARAAQRQMRARPGMAAHARGSYIRWLKGDTRNAKLLIRDALVDRDARDPEPAAWTFVEAAAIYWHEADYGGADAVYAEAFKWVPDYPGALVGRGRVALARGQPRPAIEYLEKAYRARPLPETAWLLGDAREMLGDAAGAREAYDLVVQQGRRGDKLTLALFYATKNRDLDEAFRLIEEERKARGGVYVDDAYAWVLYRAGRIVEARAASDRALRLGTKDARLLYHAGAIRLAAGDEADGRKLLAQALALNPAFDWTGAAEARRLLDAAPKKTASN